MCVIGTFLHGVCASMTVGVSLCVSVCVFVCVHVCVCIFVGEMCVCERVIGTFVH